MTLNELSELRGMLEKLHPLPQDEWQALVPLLKRRTLQKQDIFTDVGVVPKQFAYIEKGLFRLFYRDREGEEYIKHFALEGQIVGSYSALLTQSPSTLCIQALESSVIWTIDYPSFVGFYERHACWQAIGRKVAEMFFVERERKEYQLLVHSAAERYQFFKESFPGLDQRIPQYLIAAYLGITPVSLSRILNGVQGRSGKS